MLSAWRGDDLTAQARRLCWTACSKANLSGRHTQRVTYDEEIAALKAMLMERAQAHTETFTDVRHIDPTQAARGALDEWQKVTEPWLIPGVSSRPVSRKAWLTLLTEWAVPLLSSLTLANTKLVDAFFSAYKILPDLPPLCATLYVLEEALRILTASQYPWDRADGGALALALLKNLGDKAMKKIDVHSPEKDETEFKARAEAVGHHSKAVAFLGPMDIPLSVGNVRPPWRVPQAIHMLSRAIMCDTGRLGSFSFLGRKLDPELPFGQVLEAVMPLKDDILQIATSTALPPHEGLLATAAYLADHVTRRRLRLRILQESLEHWGWEERAYQFLRWKLRTLPPGDRAVDDLVDAIESLRKGWPYLRRQAREFTAEQWTRVSIKALVDGRKAALRKRSRGKPTTQYEARRHSPHPSWDEVETLPLAQTGGHEGDRVRSPQGVFEIKEGTDFGSVDICEAMHLKPLPWVKDLSAGFESKDRLLGQCPGLGAPAVIHPQRDGPPPVADCHLLLPKWTWHQARTEVNGAAVTRTSDSGVEHFDSVEAVELNDLPALLTGRETPTVRLSSAGATSDQERRLLRSALAALEREQWGLAPSILRRLTGIHEEAASRVVTYWEDAQPELQSEPSSKRSRTLHIPKAVKMFADTTPCMRPGCPGPLLPHDRVVRSVDEAVLDVLICCQPGCGYTKNA